MLDVCQICKERLDHHMQCSCTRRKAVTTIKSDQNSEAKGCPKCGGSSVSISEMSATGGMLSRMFDVQHQQFEVVSCDRCGYSEFYKRNSSFGKSLLDLFFS
ncbi:zinc ribbon domain-containing protein [Brevibacillus fluminis]|uniref:zinc ribbon domain-containing protein n=1 Tax=Brevibacillus fluminis TaxID=511487 RepID=UPI003F893D3E